jgi:organic radical activating enzyme
VSRLKITEIFYSLQGEADTAGIPTTFVRLTGCPLRCQYCDTAYAFTGGEWWELDVVLARVRDGSDLVKFVICSRADYEWSRAKLRELQLDSRCTVLFSPSHEQLAARDLADWILEDRLPVRLQIQLHKYLWGNVPGK